MASPEFQPKLDWPQAQEYRRGEVKSLRTARNSGLRDETREYLNLLHQDQLYQEAQTLTMQHRWEYLAQRIPEFSAEDWERAGKVFSGINNGVKAALFVDIAQHTRPGMYMPIENIVDDFKNLLAGTQLLEAFKKGTRKRVVSYCQESLCNVGLVTAEYSLEGELIGFGVTEDGVSFGLPHARRLLQWENTAQESAYPILGSTSSSGETRAPFNTARILEYLFRHPHSVRSADLIDNLKLWSYSVQDVLKKLSRLGLIEYKAVTSQTSKVQVEYVWDSRKDLVQAPYFGKGHELQDAVIAVIQKYGLVQNQPGFYASHIVQKLSEEIKGRWKEKSLREHLSRILSGLAREGFLQRVNDFKGGEKQSDASLTQKGRAFFFCIVLPTLLNSKVESLKTGLTWLAQTSAELYYPYSHSANKRERQNNIQKLVEAIGEVPQTANDLATRVGLSAKIINRILSPHLKNSDKVILEINGQSFTITRIKEKGVWYYSLKNPKGE